jgi:endonuclease YncB( thermonuclease family)
MWNLPRNPKAILTLAVVLGPLFACGQAKDASDPATFTPADVTPGTDVTGKVWTCHDGDTCIIKLSDNGGSLKVRFLGIDAPEVSGGDENEGQPLGQDARDALNGLIKGKSVRVHTVSRDKYDRMLSEIYLGDMLVNVEMLKRGMAQSYIWWNDTIDEEVYVSAEKHAKEAKLGIWSLTTYEEPEDFRMRTREPATED